MSFLFELYESTNANMAYEFVHHGDFTSYELYEDLANYLTGNEFSELASEFAVLKEFVCSLCAFVLLNM